MPSRLGMRLMKRVTHHFDGHCSPLCVQETIDGDLAVRVFGLLPVVDSGYHQGRYGERSRQRLDLAILSLFQAFRKIYIGEQVMHSSKVSPCPCSAPQQRG